MAGDDLIQLSDIFGNEEDGRDEAFGRTSKQEAENELARWEQGLQLPTLQTMEMVAAAADLELVIGWKKPNSAEGEVWALGAVEDEQQLTELRMIVDETEQGYRLQPTPWRQKLEDEYVTDEMRRQGLDYFDFD